MKASSLQKMTTSRNSSSDRVGKRTSSKVGMTLDTMSKSNLNQMMKMLLSLPYNHSTPLWVWATGNYLRIYQQSSGLAAQILLLAQHCQSLLSLQTPNTELRILHCSRVKKSTNGAIFANSTELQASLRLLFKTTLLINQSTTSRRQNQQAKFWRATKVKRKKTRK